MQRTYLAGVGPGDHCLPQVADHSAAFKELFAAPRGAAHVQFYLDWTKTFAGKEDIMA